MRKEQTLQKNIEAFLEGKSEKVKQKFLDKPFDKQYSSVMAWRYREKRKKETELAKSEAFSILESIKAARKVLLTVPKLTEQEIKDIKKEMNVFVDAMNNYREAYRNRQIRELELKQIEIAEQLKALRDRN